jgi:hypothetical protein
MQTVGRERSVSTWMSFNRDLAEVDFDQYRLWNELVVALVRIDPTLGWHDDAVDVSIFRGMVEACSASQDIDGVVVTTDKPIWCRSTRSLRTCGFLRDQGM